MVLEGEVDGGSEGNGEAHINEECGGCDFIDELGISVHAAFEPHRKVRDEISPPAGRAGGKRKANKSKQAAHFFIGEDGQQAKKSKKQVKPGRWAAIEESSEEEVVDQAEPTDDDIVMLLVALSERDPEMAHRLAARIGWKEA
jgi:hypothetical protein